MRENHYPKVSIIIPTYNRADILPRTIKSVLSQTFKDFELIIVDDASTDNTVEVAESFQEKDDRVKIYELEENSGAPARPKNTGIKNSKGEYIAFLDDDDEWLPEKLEKQLKLFEESKKPSLGFVGCGALIVDKNGNKTGERKIKYGENAFLKLLGENFICSSSSVVIKKEVIENVGLFDEHLKFADDWDMWIRIAQRFDFVFVNESLFKYYWHQENRMKRLQSSIKIQEHEYLLEKHKKWLKGYPSAYAIRLRHLGTMNLLADNKKKSIKYFAQSVKVNPSIRNILTFLLSFFGRRLYWAALNVKRRIAGDFYLD